MMHRFVAHRFVSSLITMALASIVVFLSIHLLPGDPVVMVLGEQAGADPMAVARVRAELGLDLPLPTQFVRWASAVLHGDLGHSLRSGEPVVAELAAADSAQPGDHLRRPGGCGRVRHPARYDCGPRPWPRQRIDRLDRGHRRLLGAGVRFRYHTGVDLQSFGSGCCRRPVMWRSTTTR